MADEPTERNSPEPADVADEFDGLVLDDSFVRGGTYEPPARTRVAIARYGDQPTSWRHGGGLRKSLQPPATQPDGGRRRPRQRAAGRPTRSARPSRSSLPSPAMARLPLIITVIVVGLAAFLAFH